MRSFLPSSSQIPASGSSAASSPPFSSSFSSAHAARARPDRFGRAIWHRQIGAVSLLVGGANTLDAEAVQRELLYRSEAFAEDLGAGYAPLRFTAATRPDAAP
ncbi:MAG: hypothetical protein JWQ88_1177 [Rhodoferax sp.]|nr:hypothetical protein [Rhodoferax sp.]